MNHSVEMTSSLACLHYSHPSLFFHLLSPLPSPLLRALNHLSVQSHKVSDALPPPTVPIGSDYICPHCEQHDDGTPMICCDSCDEWLHWWVKVREWCGDGCVPGYVVGMGVCVVPGENCTTQSVPALPKVYRV